VGYGVDFCLYASVLDVKRCADCCDGTVTRFSTCGARLRGYSCFRLPHFGSVLNCQYRSIQVQVSIFQLSTIATLYKKRPRGVQRGAALCPFAVFSHSNVIYPLRASAVHVPYSRRPQPMRHIRPMFRNPCGIYGRDSAIYAAIRPGPPQPMRLLFPHTKFRKYLINKVFPK
jgi:hypothetical protein